MKKLIFLLCFLFVTGVSSNVFCQIRIGFSFSEINTELNEKIFPERYFGLNMDGKTNHLIIKSYLGVVGYYFNEKNICDEGFLIPLNDSMYNYMVNKFDSICTKSNDKSWIYTDYKNKGITLVKIIDDPCDETVEKNGRYFYFTPLN